MNRWIIIAGILVVLIAVNIFYLLQLSSRQVVQAPSLPQLAKQLIPSGIKPQDESITLFAAGDIMLSRNVAATIKAQRNDHYPFEAMQQRIAQADIAFANLESPITAGPEVKTGSFTFHANPGIEQSLAWAGFDVLSLANNHLPNYGEQGIKDTVSLLDAVGIKHAGAGADAVAALKPAIIEVKGKKFGFLAFNDSDVVPPSYGAGQNRAGTNIMDEAKLKQAIAQLRSQVDFVIVSMHSGIEYTPQPNQHQQDFAHAAIDDGADLVIGHHPHVVQSLEKYKDKYILYSLGNFVFDQMFSIETRQGLTAIITFGPSGVTNVWLAPILIENYAQPRPLNVEEALDVVRRFTVPVTTSTRDNLVGWSVNL